MARYYFHIRDGWTVIRDEQGMECADMNAARAEAYASARDLAPTNDSRVCAVEIADRYGNVLGSIKVARVA